MNSRVRFVALALLLLPLAIAFSQEKKSKQDADDKGRPTFRLPVNVIVVNVTVAGKDGNPVTDLVQDDFKIYEDGKLQAIQTFARESYEPAELEAGSKQDRNIAPRTVESAPSATRPRMISVFIDDITAESRDEFPAMIRAITKFIEDDVCPDDQVSIVSGSGRVRYPFTDDKQTLREEIKAVLAKLSFDPITQSDCPELTNLQAQRIAENYVDGLSDSEIQASNSANREEIAGKTLEVIRGIAALEVRVALEETIVCLSLDPGDPQSLPIAQNHMRSAARRQINEEQYRAGTLLQTLKQHLRTLRHFDAAKSLVVFSDGFLSEIVSPTTYNLQDVVDQALASGVTLNTVDIRGLYTSVIPASKGPFASSASVATYKPSLYLADMSAQEEPLARMANETGGLFFHNSNDLYDGLRQIVHRHSFYYVLTYAMPSQRSDGKYHQIKIVLSRPGLDISYRKGYFAPREELTFERRKKEDILEALQAPGNLNEIPIALAYNYYQEDDSRYAVSLSTNVSIRGLHFLDEDSRRKNLIHIVVAAFDEMDHFVDGIEKSVDFKLTEANYATLLANGFRSRVELKLPLGRYKIKTVVREASEGKMGSATRTVEIP